MTIVLFQNLFAKRGTSRAFDMHSFSLSLDPQEMSLNIDMNIILPVKFSGVSSNPNSKTFDFVTELQRIESWENIPLEVHWLAVESVTVSPNLSSHASFDWGSRVSYQDTIQNL